MSGRGCRRVYPTNYNDEEPQGSQKDIALITNYSDLDLGLWMKRMGGQVPKSSRYGPSAKPNVVDLCPSLPMEDAGWMRDTERSSTTAPDAF